MINELHYLSQCLNKCEVTTEKTHPWMQPPKKGSGLRIILDDSAHVKKVEYLNAESVSSLWNIKQSKHKMFPVMNLTTPLWEVKELPDITQLLELRKKKASVANTISIVSQILQRGTFCFSNTKDLLNKVYQFPYETLSTLVEDIQEFAAFNKLIAICTQLHDEEVIKSMVQEVSNTFLEALQNGRIDDTSLMYDMFFGKWDEKKKQFGEAKITITFDIDYTDMPIDCVQISSAEMKAYINRILFKTRRNDQEEDYGQKNTRSDAFGSTGKFISPLPEPNLPIFGPSFLMSMNENTPCHSRYRNIGCAIFPVTEETAYAMNDAVLYLKKEENQGKTWEKVPCAKENDLLLVYLEKMPDAGVNIANALGPGVDNADFESYASAACDALNLKLDSQDDSYIRLLLIRKVSPGQRVIRYATAFTVKNLNDSVRFWCDAAHNIPPFSLFIKAVKEANEKEAKDTFIQVSPVAPFLGKIFQELQFQWLKNGASREDIKGGRLGDMYQLFLHPTTTNATHYLDKLLRRMSPFWIRFKQEQVQPKRLRVWKDKDYEEYTRIMLDSVAFTGILLKILGREKEEYMKSSGYYVGRLLSLADLLHEQYCIHVRNKGDKAKGLPPQLLGNSLMRSAMDNPVQTLARLQERLMVYYAWATKEQGEHVKLAHWAMGQMGEISEALAELELPNRTNDTMKAEILLGYLAKPKKD